MIKAIVLAAGLSSRMEAKNKLLLPFRGKAILQHTIDALLATQVERIIVVTGHEQEKVTSLLENVEVSITHNEAYQQGQLTSIQKGLEQLSDNCTAFMVCLSDMPLIEAKAYDELIQTYQLAIIDQPIVLPHNGKRAGNPKLFHLDYKEQILALDAAEHQGAKAVLKRNFDKIIAHQTENDAFFMDIDTPAAYQALLKR
ncbi:MAG: nucleotidyltransferase family protein [Bacteroidota bacterium]